MDTSALCGPSRSSSFSKPRRASQLLAQSSISSEEDDRAGETVSIVTGSQYEETDIGEDQTEPEAVASGPPLSFRNSRIWLEGTSVVISPRSGRARVIGSSRRADTDARDILFECEEKDEKQSSLIESKLVNSERYYDICTSRTVEDSIIETSELDASTTITRSDSAHSRRSRVDVDDLTQSESMNSPRFSGDEPQQSLTGSHKTIKRLPRRLESACRTEEKVAEGEKPTIQRRPSRMFSLWI